jgi:hypothetical protein
MMLFLGTSLASAVAQGTVVTAIAASYSGKAEIRPFANTKPLHIKSPNVARLILLVTLTTVQESTTTG